MSTNTMKSGKFDQRIIAYFDILGFKELIADADETQNITQIKSILDIFHKFEKPKRSSIIKHPNYDGKRFCTTFSDNIVISFDIDLESEVLYTLSEILDIIIELVNKKILVRGSVVLGNIYHDNTYLFGSGLVKAYEFEQYCFYPRIIVDKEVIAVAKKKPLFLNSPDIEYSMITSMLSSDLDGIPFIDYFHLVEESFNDGIRGMDKYYENLRETIIHIEAKTKKNTSLYIKYKWLEKKYNDSVFDINQNYGTNYKIIEG